MSSAGHGAMTATPGAAGGRPDLDRAPITVAWELTRACPLRCDHCRAEAIRHRDPRELDTAEGAALIDEIAALGARVLVLTGGDPLARPDLGELIAHGRAAGLHVAVSPATTGRLTREAVARLADAGAQSVHVSVDGASEAVHDGLRGVRGSHARALRVLGDVVDHGMRLQVGTSVTRLTADELPDLAELLRGWPLAMWNLFFLVPTGRARPAQLLDADEHEAVLRWLAEAAEELPYPVRTTAAPAYRRVRSQLGLDPPPAGSANDGKGFCFVSHTGEVHPSGFLPLPVGHVRRHRLADLYREAPLFRMLRDPARLGGDCGRCDFRAVCGGSRARAYALTGDPLAADPTCAYTPPAPTAEPALHGAPAGA